MTDDARTNLLHATCEVIAAKGVEGFRTKDVAEVAGLSTALLHYYFGSKRALVLASFEYSDDTAIGAVTRAVGPDASGRDQLRDYLMAWASDDPVLQRHWVVWAEMWRWSMFEPELRRAVSERHGRFISALEELVERGKEDGSISDAVVTSDAAQRLAACSDSFGDQAVVGILSVGEVRDALARAIEHECPHSEARR